MQRRILPIFLAAGIIFVAVFGFLGMSLTEHNMSYICPFSILSGSECPPAGDALALTAHHISGLQSLTQAVIGFDATLLILSFLLLAIIPLTSLKLLQQGFSNFSNFSYQRHCLVKELDFVPNRQFLHWLAIKNKRYPHALQWVHDVA